VMLNEIVSPNPATIYLADVARGLIVLTLP
jgi:hypothetical protein